MVNYACYCSWSSHVAVFFSIQGTNIDEECWTIDERPPGAAMIESGGDRDNDWNCFLTLGLLEYH